MTIDGYKPVRKAYARVILLCLLRYFIYFIIAMVLMITVVVTGFATEALSFIPEAVQVILMLVIPFLAGSFLIPLLMKIPFFMMPADYEAVYTGPDRMLLAKTDYAKFSHTYYFYSVSKIYQIKSNPFVWELKASVSSSSYYRPGIKPDEAGELMKLTTQQAVPMQIKIGKIYGRYEREQIKELFKQLS